MSPYIRHCACLAIDMLNVTDSVQLLQRIAGVDLSHIRHAAVKVLERWGQSLSLSLLLDNIAQLSILELVYKIVLYFVNNFHFLNDKL